MAVENALAFVEDQYKRFCDSFENHDFAAASDAFVAAISAAPNIGFRYFMVRASGSIVASLHATGRTATVGHWLGGLLAEYRDMHLMLDYEPAKIAAIFRRREEHVANGLPSVALISQGKSASIPVSNIFNSGYRLPSLAYSLGTLEVIEAWAREFARGGACYTTHLEPRRESIVRLQRAAIGRVIVHVRDPRQALLSFIHHVRLYPEQEPALVQSGFTKKSPSEQVQELLPRYRHQIEWIQGWLDAEKMLGIFFSTFEDFAADRRAFTERYVNLYGFEEHFSAERATGADVAADQHFRKGSTDEWRAVFPAEDIDLVTSLLPHAMRDRFGWQA